jgi:hypothetical protein
VLAACIHAVFAAIMVFGGTTSATGETGFIYGAVLGVALFGSAALCSAIVGAVLFDNSGRLIRWLASRNDHQPKAKTPPAPFVAPTDRIDQSVVEAPVIAEPLPPVKVKTTSTSVRKFAVPISAQLTTLFVQMTNYDLDIYDDKILFDLVFTNHTDRRIRAFKGDLVFWDLFDAEVFRMGLTMNTPIKAGRSVKWSGEFQYNQFVPEQIHLAGFKASDLKVSIDNPQIAG